MLLVMECTSIKSYINNILVNNVILFLEIKEAYYEQANMPENKQLFAHN